MSILMKICTSLMISALSVPLYAQGQPQPDNPDQVPSGPVVDATNTPEVIQALYVINVVEVKAADLVLTKNPAEDLKAYAEELKDAHTKAADAIKEIANVKSVSLKPEEIVEKIQALEELKTAEIEALAQKPDTEFRGAFLTAIIAAHQQYLELLNRIEQQNTDDALKLIVALFRQQAEKHLSDAQKLQIADEQEPEVPTQPQEPTN